MLRAALTLTLLLCCASAAAHNTWFAPQAPDASRKHWVLLLSTGSAFPVQDDAPSERRIARADLVSSSRTLTLFALSPTATALPFRVVADTDEVQVAVAALKPNDVELDPAAVDIYLAEEVGDDPTFRARYTQQGHWRERYTKNAKTLLRMHGDAPAAIATQPHGLAFELVPTVDPTLLDAGTAFEICAYANGKRVRRDDARIRIGLVQADGAATTQPGNADGCAHVMPSTNDGYLLHSILLRSVERDDIDWESDFASLTVGRAAAAAPPP